VDRGEGACRRRLERTDRPPADAAGEFARAGDRGVIRHVDEAATRIGAALRRTADAPRVKQRRGAVEVEDVGALDEERPSLGEVLLKRRQVHVRGVGVDLTEVGIDRRVERKARRQSVLRVHPDTGNLARAVIERRLWTAGIDALLAGRRVWDELET